MANVKISELTAITSSDDLADADIVPIVDSSDSTTKRTALSVLCSYFGGGGGSSVWCTGTNTAYLLTDCVGIGTATPGTDIMFRVQGDTCVTGDIKIGGDVCIGGDDLFMNTNTSGYMLIADGTNFNPVAMSGDIAIDSAGATTIQATSVDNSMLAGSIANAKLSNSSITLSDGSNTTAISLGGTMTFSGTSNEIEVAESSGTVTIGLPSIVTGLTTVCATNFAGTLATAAQTNVTSLGTLTALTASGNVSFDGGTFVFNESGADLDFRIEGDSDANLLIADASTDRIGIGTATPDYLLSVAGNVGFDEYIYHNGDTNTFIRLEPDEINIQVGGEKMISMAEGGGGTQADKITINDNDTDIDFQVKGTSDSNLIRTDAANDRVGIGTATPATTLHVQGATCVTGAVNVGGDLTISGDDLIMGTNTSGHILVADGTNYNPVAVSGDVTIDSSGAVTIAATSVENSMLAGSIANAKLSNSSVSYGGVSLSLGGTDATPAFNLCDATAYKGDSALVTVGTVTSGTWQGTAVATAYVAAAQTNITSLGTLTALTVDNICLDGATIGHTSDTDLMTLADGVLTVSGRLDAGSDVKTDAIRRYSDSSTTTKILLNDEVIKLNAGHSSNEVVKIASGAVTIDGDLTICGDDLIMATNTSGYLLVADGTNYNPVAMSGDIAIDNGGATTIQATSVDNSMLAGSIANDKLSNSSVSYGGISLSLGGTDATPAFNLCDATAYKGDSALVTVGTITSGTWSGVIDGSATMTMGSDATGDIYYRDASGFLERLGASTDGYVLTTGGDGTVPAWEAAASSGISWDGSTANGVATFKDSDEATVEANLTFDGSLLTVGSTAQKAAEIYSSNANPYLVIAAEAETQNDTAGIAFNATKGQAIGSANTIAQMVGKVTNSGGTLTGDLIFYTNGGDSEGERMRILSSGGITFNGDTAAANALDDYEEGTWNVCIRDGSNNAMTNSVGYTCGLYTKIGNVVYVSVFASTSSLGSTSGQIYICGFPYTVGGGGDSQAEYTAFSTGYASGLAITAGTYITANIIKGSTYATLRHWDVASGVSGLQASEWSADGTRDF